MNPECRFCREWIDNQDGQATAEYILLLSIIMAMFVVAIKDLLLPAIERLAGNLKRAIESTIFKKGAMHHLNLGG